MMQTPEPVPDQPAKQPPEPPRNPPGHTVTPGLSPHATKKQTRVPVSDDDMAYQQQALIGVSRTFALTIPQLPSPLCDTVANAYLLCRIADTIEDAPNLSAEVKQQFSEQFLATVEGHQPAEPFVAQLSASLDQQTPYTERDLILHTEAVLRLTHSYSPRVRQALVECIRIMSRGMAQFAQRANASGLDDLAELDRYCYVVAGVVGEMLTELFCDYSAPIAAQHSELKRLSVSFGQGLQMTNILKDIWDDQQRGISWLPRALFEQHQCQPEQLFSDTGQQSDTRHRVRQVQLQLIAITHGHLCDALEYTLLLPVREAGLRRFCLLAIGMALLTLQKLRRHPDYRSGAEVKISRRAVRGTLLVSHALRFVPGVQDRVIRWLFTRAARGLPCQRRPHGLRPE